MGMEHEDTALSFDTDEPSRRLVGESVVLMVIMKQGDPRTSGAETQQ